MEGNGGAGYPGEGGFYEEDEDYIDPETGIRSSEKKMRKRILEAKINDNNRDYLSRVTSELERSLGIDSTQGADAALYYFWAFSISSGTFSNDYLFF